MPITDPETENLPKKATRDGYGQGLFEAGGSDSSIVVLEADLSGSTKTRKFADNFPDRFLNFGVAEQNMIGHAAGLAISGMKPVASSFAMFAAGRAWEIVRNSVAYPGLNVKIAATHAGITLGEDGASHQIIEDIGIMRAIPGMTVIVPADYEQARQAIKASLSLKGPVYIRLGRPNIPVIYSESDKFEIGKASILQEGEDIAFFATGIMVYEAFKAARIIEKQKGVRPWVVNFATIKPLDQEFISSLLPGLKQIFTFEEHNVMTGFGSAIAEYVCRSYPVKIHMTGIQDKFGQSGTVSDLMKHYRLTAEQLAEDLSGLI